jgi:hypothetical protein
MTDPLWMINSRRYMTDIRQWPRSSGEDDADASCHAETPPVVLDRSRDELN